jgi:hypothetical protein
LRSASGSASAIHGPERRALPRSKSGERRFLPRVEVGQDRVQRPDRAAGPRRPCFVFSGTIDEAVALIKSAGGERPRARPVGVEIAVAGAPASYHVPRDLIEFMTYPAADLEGR